MFSEIPPFLMSVAGAGLACWIIIITVGLHGTFTLDFDTEAVQKYHKRPVPRIGGLALLVGLICGGVYHGLEADQELYLAKWAGVAVIPVFLGGVLEDLRKGMTARDRLLLAFFSATIAHYELNVGLERIDWLWFDTTIISVPGVTLLLTVVMVGGLSHATNIIDGFNGLLLGVTLMTLSAFAWVGHQVNDPLLVTYLGIMLGAVLGVFLFNFPSGRIFLGDGGAYVIGFFLAVFALILVKKHLVVSPWFPLTVLAYPVMETLFSMFRKKVVSRIPVMAPDRYHFHMLVHDNLVANVRFRWMRNSNATTAVIMWGVYLFGLVPGVLWWDNTRYLLAAFFIFICLYVVLYLYLLKRIQSVVNA